MKYNFNQQQGMSLVVVVMLTAIASLLVFTVLNNTVSQSRMSGNFQKAINAEYQADKAIYDAYHKLNQAITTNPEISDAALAEYALIGKTPSHDSRYYSTSALSLAEGRLNVTSQGYFHHDSESRGGVILKRYRGTDSNTGESNPLFTSGLIGCEGVALEGSGSISSYSSNDSSASFEAVLTQTVKPGSHVTLNGAAPIQGDVLSTGNITMRGSSVVSGRVHAQGNVILDSGSGTINGPVWAQGSISVVNTLTVKGEIKANGNINISNGAKLHGGIFTLSNLSLTNGPDVQGDTWVKGDIRIPKWVADGNLFKNKNRIFYGGTTEHNFGQRSANINIVEVPAIPSEWQDLAGSSVNDSCDAINITPEIVSLKQYAPANTAALEIKDAGSSGQRYRFTPTEAFTGLMRAPAIYQPTGGLFYGSNRMIYFLKGLSVAGSPPNNGLVIDEGDVTIFIDGNFSMVGSPKIEIKTGSTLTLIVTGRVFLEQGEIITPSPKITATGTPVFSIFSTYSSSQSCSDSSTTGCGIIIGNGFKEAYGALYTPFAGILVNSGSTFSGSVVGKTVTVKGAGQIKYDVALTKAKVGGGGGSNPGTSGTPRVSFLGWGK